jgi:hypothetical protein
MATNHINLTPSARIDMSDVPRLSDTLRPSFKPRSYDQIIAEMIQTLSVSMGSHIEIRPGSVTYTLISVMANQVYVLEHMMSDWSFQAENLKLPEFVHEFKDSAIVLHKGNFDECECGKEKHGFASHSTWCKQYTPNM